MRRRGMVEYEERYLWCRRPTPIHNLLALLPERTARSVFHPEVPFTLAEGFGHLRLISWMPLAFPSCFNRNPGQDQRELQILCPSVIRQHWMRVVSRDVRRSLDRLELGIFRVCRAPIRRPVQLGQVWSVPQVRWSAPQSSR